MDIHKFFISFLYRMYLLLLLFIVIVFYPKKDGFKNAKKKNKTQNYKITNEERQGILTSHSYM